LTHQIRRRRGKTRLTALEGLADQIDFIRVEGVPDDVQPAETVEGEGEGPADGRSADFPSGRKSMTEPRILRRRSSSVTARRTSCSLAAARLATPADARKVFAQIESVSPRRGTLVGGRCVLVAIPCELYLTLTRE
jgi:hypothetical protein